MVNIVVDAAVAIKLFRITVQNNTILPTNIHSYLVVCETLFDNRRKRESGKERQRERQGGGRNRKGERRREIRKEKSGVRGLERKGKGREQEEKGEVKREEEKRGGRRER